VDFVFGPGQITYQAQSPDESALVLAARDFGFVFKVTLSSTTGFLISAINIYTQRYILKNMMHLVFFISVHDLLFTFLLH